MGFEEFCNKYDIDAELLDDLWLMDVLAALNRKYDAGTLYEMLNDYIVNAGFIERDIKQSILDKLEEK